jgi:hypothetical protein
VCNAAGNLVDEFNEALPTMRALGFTIKDLRVGAGLLPQIAVATTRTHPIVVYRAGSLTTAGDTTNATSGGPAGVASGETVLSFSFGPPGATANTKIENSFDSR